MRPATTAVQNALAGGHVRMVLLVTLYLDSATLRITNAPQNVVWGSNTYIGAGNAAHIRSTEEVYATEPRAIELILASPVSAYLQIALQEPVQGRRCDLHIGLLDDSYQLIADPVLEHSLYCDHIRVEEGKEVAQIVLRVESPLAGIMRSNVKRFSNADQQEVAPGDMFFEYLDQIAEKPIIWPAREWFLR